MQVNLAHVTSSPKVQLSSLEPEAKAQTSQVLQRPCFAASLHGHKRGLRLEPDWSGTGSLLLYLLANYRLDYTMISNT